MSDARRLTHVGDDGGARMVDVSAKGDTERIAHASGTIRMDVATLDAIRDNQVRKGDVLGVAKVAGILAAKRTAELVPLCHSLTLTDVQVNLRLDDSLPGVRADAVVRTVGKTGVEMEAITAVAVALVTVYDMTKALDRRMVISDIMLLEKDGGRRGPWRRE